MEIELKLIRKREHPKIKRETVPVCEDMKSRLEQAKRKGVDVNEMTRLFWEKVISEAESA